MLLARWALCAAALLLAVVLAHAGHDHDHDHDHGDDYDMPVGADGEVAGGGDYDDEGYDDEGYDDEGYDDEDYPAGGDYGDDGGADMDYGGGSGGGGDDFMDPSLLADFDANMKAKMDSMANPFGGGGDFGDLDGMLGGAGDLEDLPDFEQAMAEDLMAGEGAAGGGGAHDEGGAARVKSPLPIGLDCANLAVPTMKKDTELVRACGRAVPPHRFV